MRFKSNKILLIDAKCHKFVISEYVCLVFLIFINFTCFGDGSENDEIENARRNYYV